MTEPSELLAIAREAAEAAGAVLLETASAPAEDVQTKSGPTDLVSEADHAAERAVVDLLSERRPGDLILGEEGGEQTLGDAEPEAGGVRWVVDPLDGTVNFLFGIPQWCVSVACEDDDGAIAGVILDPSRGETFAATRGGPATLDGEPIEGSQQDELHMALIATGFSYDADVRALQGETVSALLPRVRDIRRLGSAALDLCWTACGRYDAFYERALNHWDRAAGALICAQAGLELRELEATDDLPAGLVVAPGPIVEPLFELVDQPAP